MVLVQEYSLPVRILAPRAFPTAVGDVEQQPPVGETPFRPRSPAMKPIFLAVMGAWSGHAKPDLRPHALPEGSWDVREASGGCRVAGEGGYPSCHHLLRRKWRTGSSLRARR